MSISEVNETHKKQIAEKPLDAWYRFSYFPASHHGESRRSRRKEFGQTNEIVPSDKTFPTSRQRKSALPVAHCCFRRRRYSHCVFLGFPYSGRALGRRCRRLSEQKRIQHGNYLHAGGDRNAGRR